MKTYQKRKSLFSRPCVLQIKNNLKTINKGFENLILCLQTDIINLITKDLAGRRY